MLHRNTSKTLYTLLFVGVFVMSVTLTWNFLSSFLPDDPPWLRPAAFVCFEGGLLVWAHIHKYTAENVQRHQISGIMTFVCLAACGTATFYEVAHGIHSLGFVIPPAVSAVIPWCIIGVMGSELVAVTRYFFADPIYYARRQFMDQHGETKQFQIAPISQQQTGELPALPNTVVQSVNPQPGWRQRIGNKISGQQQIAAPTQHPDVSLSEITRLLQQLQAQQPVQNTPADQDLMEDLIDSVGDATSPKFPAPSPNGAKPNSQK
jgi:hypothetical protein